MKKRMKTSDRIRGIAMAAAGALWLAPPVLADSSPEPILLAENSVRDEAPAGSDRGPDVAAKAPSATGPTRGLPIFVPRTSRGAPASRIGGASRGVETGLVVRVLVPEHDEAALTLSEQPSLPWHLSRETAHAINFTLIDPNAVEPILDVTIAGPYEAGFHQIDLAEHGARLAAGKAYQWFVAVVPNPERRSADVVARGSVERVVQGAPLAAQIAAASPADRPGVLGAAGIWYDTLEAIGKQPASLAQAQRDALLAQVGIEFEARD